MKCYLSTLLVLLIARALDLATTHLVSPDLRAERNPIVYLMGWRNTILLNLAVIPFLAMWFTGAAALVALSFMATIINVHNALE